jgi:hypothetical protein
MTKKRVGILLLVLVLSALAAFPAFAGGRGSGPIVFVTSQGMYYDSIVTADPLPPHGPFQLLEVIEPGLLMTEFGPGDPGYVGGRWMLVGEDGVTQYFSCPLLGPGRAAP